MKKRYNIMSSCDDNLVPYLAIELTSIAYNLKDSSIEFFFLHSDKITQKNIDMLNALCNELKIHFHEITVYDHDIYSELAEYGGGWAGEAYYSLCAHLLLPDDIDRVLYIDAGDILVLGDIEPYYNYDFNGKSLIVTGARYKHRGDNLVMLDKDDIMDSNWLPWILRGIFNSGSFVLNLNKMREDNVTLADYQYLLLKIREIMESDAEHCQYLASKIREVMGKSKNKRYYWGDQGLLSVAFAGDIQYYAYPEIKDIWYIPYNFGLWYFNCQNQKPVYSPVVLHFCGCGLKPWKGNYPIFLDRFQNKEQLQSMNKLPIGLAEYYYIWHEYAVITNEILERIGF